ncbi:MAG TPA: oligopeptide/dipeptide ABC transporter ATP-binding protein [Nevskiaceae bacterium]
MNPTPEGASNCLLSIRRLSVRMRPDRRSPWSGHELIQAVELFDLDVCEGESLIVTGETGTGKTVLARTLAGLQVPSAGSVRLGGQEMPAHGHDAATRAWQQRIQLVAQSPLAGIAARTKVRTVLERQARHLLPQAGNDERRRRIAGVIPEAGLVVQELEQRLHELSPLTQFRLALARALLSRPRILICDAPGATLEIPEQKQVLDLLVRLRHRHGMALVLTALDARPWRGAVDRVVVMYLGRIMEQGGPQAVFDTPAHPYTRALLASRVRITTDRRGVRRAELHVPGDPPNPAHPPIGCVFHPRCPIVDPACLRGIPPLRRTGSSPHHYAACLFAPPTDTDAESLPTPPLAGHD